MANSQGDNVWASYQTGLNEARAQIAEQLDTQDHRFNEFLIYEQRLWENVERTKDYGDNETRRSNRAEIIDQLNQLLRDTLGVSFNELTRDHAAWEQETHPSVTALNQSLLPTPSTSLIGREQEISEVCGMLQNSDKRFVTIIGPGGVGKTRLGLQVAGQLQSSFDHGVFFVSLASTSDPELVIPAIAQVLGIRETAGQTLMESIQFRIHNLCLLLLLDNFEHVLDAGPQLSDLLGKVPRLKMLVTSRSRLNLSGECCFSLVPMDLPDPATQYAVDDLVRFSSIALFIERVQAINSNFLLTKENAAAVAEICILLDGLPLAIELAAARTRVLPPQKMLEQLKDRLRFLAGGFRDLPSRQQSLRHTIDWSYNLLNMDEQNLFVRLAVFANGCTFEAIEAICMTEDTDTLFLLEKLETLVDASLLRCEENHGEPRYLMLSTIHEYALEKLKTCEDAPNIYQHYVQYFLHLVKSVSDNFQSFAQMEQEYPNIRAALEWLYRQGDKETLAQFGALLWPFWESHHHLSEGRHWLHIMLQSTELPASLRGEVLIGVGALAGSQGDYAEAHRLFEESLKLWKSMDQSDGIATSLVNLGIVASRQGNYTRAVDFYEEAMPLYDPLRNRLQIANLLCNQGITELDQGHYDHAWSLFAESQQLLQEVPDADIETMANIRMNLGRLAMHRGSHEEAQAHLEESLSAFRQSGDQRSVAFSRLYLGDVVYIKDGPIQAASFYSESLHYFHQVYDLASMGECLERLASVAAALEQPEIATQLYGVVAAMRRSITVPQPPAHRSRHDQIKADIRLRLGDESFDSAWNIGQRMCLDDIFDLLKNLRRTELAAPDSTSSHLEEQGGNG